jgi:polyferredoxin
MALEFGAPWSRSLKTGSAVAVVVLVAVTAAGIFLMPTRVPIARLTMIVLPMALLALAFVSMVSGYTLDSTTLTVKRPFWTTVIPLSALVSVAGDAEAFKGSVRLFGNGGFFSFTGLFWNRKLGCYRAFATDPARAVVLKFAKRTIVITPDDTLHFIVRIRTHLAAIYSQ